MNCSELRALKDAYVDGELDVVKTIEIDGHLAVCGGCVAVFENAGALSAAIRSANLYYKAPQGLEERVRASLRPEDAPAARGGSVFRRWRGFAAAAACGALAASLIIAVFTTPDEADRIADDVASSHVRSMMATHLTDVTSTDQHTVKPWFDGKLDFAPPVIDLVSQGFPLVGGRLDYLANRPVAALVYQRGKHVINVFIWPASDTSASGQTSATRQGYNMVRWNSAGMTFWAASDLNARELATFASLIAAQAIPPR